MAVPPHVQARRRREVQWQDPPVGVPQLYTIAMQAVGARDDKVLANYFPLALKPNVMSWLMHLPADSISSGSDLCHEFVGAFTGSHQAHGQASDLHIIPQKEGENLRKYI